VLILDRKGFWSRVTAIAEKGEGKETPAAIPAVVKRRFSR